MTTTTTAIRTDDDWRLLKYLHPSESIVVSVRRHWAFVWEPVLLCIGSLVAILAIGFTARAGSNEVVSFLWKVWLVVLARALFHVFRWRREWIIATDERLMLIHGVVDRQVAMLPLTKVTDMTYHRTILGHLLGYGTFRVESAGQDQALSELRFIPDPDRTYRTVVGKMFGKDSPVETVTDDEELVQAQESRVRALFGVITRSRPRRRPKETTNQVLGHDGDVRHSPIAQDPVPRRRRGRRGRTEGTGAAYGPDGLEAAPDTSPLPQRSPGHAGRGYDDDGTTLYSSSRRRDDDHRDTLSDWA